MKRRKDIRQANTQQKKKSLHLKFVFFFLIIGLLLGNVLAFASTVKLTDSITKLESKTQKIRKENAQLNQKLYTENSIAILEYLAEDMGFTKEAEPFYLDNVGYALAR